MVGKKVVHHLMMSAKDAHYVGGLVNGARIVDQWGDVGTELMVYVDGDISLFLGLLAGQNHSGGTLGVLLLFRLLPGLLQSFLFLLLGLPQRVLPGVIFLPKVKQGKSDASYNQDCPRNLILQFSVSLTISCIFHFPASYL